MLMGIADTFMLSALSDDAVSGVGAANQYLHIAILVLEVMGTALLSSYLNTSVPNVLWKHLKYQL